jgi:glycosyltransferase involved in cell wall biosynthesis
MNLLLVYNHLSNGGIETLIVRAANWLVRNGEKVSLLLRGRGDLCDLLDPNVRLLIAPHPYRCYRRGFLRSYMADIAEERPDCVWSFDPPSMILALHVLLEFNIKSKFLSGVYHPNAYFFEHHPTEAARIARQLFRDFLPSSSKYFMNQECRISHERQYHTHFEGSHLLPVPVNTKRFASLVRHPDRRILLSVGRLTLFKTYNLSMIEVVKKLRCASFDVEWHVYGKGPLEVEMQKQIEREELQNHVFLHGEIPYSALERVFENAYAFVGMGTSLIEASSAGIPSIVTVIDEPEAFCYGLFPDVPLFSLGERVLALPPQAIDQCLANLIQMPKDTYEAECSRGKRHAGHYDIDNVMSEFLKIIANLPWFTAPSQTRNLIQKFYQTNLIHQWLEMFLRYPKAGLRKLCLPFYPSKE